MTTGEAGPDDLRLEGLYRDVLGDRRRRLGELAVARGWMTPTQLAAWLAQPAAGASLVSRGLVTEAQLEDLVRELSPAGSLPASRPPPVQALPNEVTQALADPAKSFGRYILVEEIGRGAMGTVWRAWDHGMGRWVALKILRDEASPAARDRFLREVRTAAGLRHPNLITVFDAGEWRGRQFLAMELVRGAPMNPAGPLPASIAILIKVARGLDEAHRQGIIHRDLKPGNIMVDEAGEPRVVDFGLAYLPESQTDLTRTGAALGTPAYMAPEQIRGAKEEIGPATDVYALGAILYEAATGRTPHAGDTSMDLFRRALDQEPVAPSRINPALPRDVETIALKALEKDPARRYPSALAFAKDLERHLQGEPILARPVGAWTQLWRRGVKQRRVILPAAAALAIAAVSIAWSLSAAAERDAKLREARDEAARREAADAEAWKRLEVARPAIDKAFRAVYEDDVDPAEVEKGLSGARSLIEEVVRRSPRLALGHYLLGRTLDLQGEEEAAEAAWRAAIAADPAFAPARYQLARILILRAYAQHVVGSEPSDPGALAAEALDEMAKAAASGSGFEDELQREVARAMSAYVRKEEEEVLALCRKALERFDGKEGSEFLHWLVGLVSKGDEKILAFGRAMAIRPRFAWALFSRAVAHGRGAPGRAIPDLSKAIEIRPRFHQAYFMRGYILRATGDLQGALDNYTEAIRVHPGFVVAWYNRGNVRVARRELAEALADFTEAVRLDPMSAHSRYNRGSTNAELGRMREAEADFSESIRLNPAYASAWNGRAHARQALGDAAGALADFDEAIRLDPKYESAHHYRGLLRASLGNLDGAIEDLGEAIRINPQQPLSRVRRAELFRRTGDGAAALSDYQAALEVARPGWPEREAVEQAIRELQGGH